MAWPVLKRSLLVTAIAMLAALAISYSVRFALGSSFTTMNFAMGLIISAAVAFPTALVVFTQSQALSDAHAELNFRASHDGLTKLLNREGFMACVSAIEAAGSGYGLLMIDADHFRRINDGHGHAEGDRALILIAEALQRSCRPHDTVGRVGGEEFAAVLPEIAKVEDAHAIAERMRRAVENIQWLTVAGRKTRLTVTIGGAIGTPGAKSDDILREADRSLYSAKAGGRNRVSFNAKALDEGSRLDDVTATSIAT